MARTKAPLHPRFTQKSSVRKSSSRKTKKISLDDTGSKKRKLTKAEERKRLAKVNYKLYIRRVLKEVHPEASLAKSSMAIVESFVKDTFERIVSEASQLVKHTQKSTLTDHDLSCAVKLVVPGILSTHSLTTATKAMTNYKESLPEKQKPKQKPKKKIKQEPEDTTASVFPAVAAQKMPGRSTLLINSTQDETEHMDETEDPTGGDDGSIDSAQIGSIDSAQIRL